MNSVKVAIISPMIGTGRSGSGCQAVWIIEALKDIYDLSLITTSRVSFNRLNEYWGTTIDLKDINIVKFPQFFLKYTERFNALRYSVVSRYCKRISSEFDVMFSTYNTMDLGKRGIQYIGDFLFSDILRDSLYPVPLKREIGWFNRNTYSRKIYFRIAKYINYPSQENIWKNLTLVNSEWTKKLMKETYNVDSKVVYPPGSKVISSVSWNKKEDGFVCVGKLVPFKQIERIIAILDKVRKKYFDIHLHIIGWEEDSSYTQKIKRLCDRNSSWCFLEGEMFGEKKLRFISKHKFGINGCQNEAFGIAIAEMVMAGCLVFVPNGGGQKEIVMHPDLIYENVDDAVVKIERIIRDSKKQIELREHLKNQGKRFTTEKFIVEIRKIVRQFIETKI